MSLLFFLILILQIMMGLGILAVVRTQLPRTMSIPLAVLSGMFAHTVLLFCIDLMQLGIGRDTMISTAVCGAVAANVWLARTGPWYRELLGKPTGRLHMHDVIAVGFALILGYYVVWATWYWPVTPFDAMAGIDLVAKQTIVEGTIVNRVFTDASLEGHLSNQPFYAPFTMLMQVIYRLLGFGYGQVWLGVAAVAFSWFLWGALRRVVQPFIANILSRTAGI